MKKTLYILASLTAVLFASCAKEVEVKEETIDEPVAGTTLRAAVEGVDTKVSANAVGVYNWQASDKIAVLDDAGDVYEFTAASAGTTSEFNCASSITLGSYAAYPYSTSFAATGDAVTFVIPSTIIYSADATNMPMLGKISGDVVTFKAVGGLLKLIVYGVPSGSTQLEFAAKAQKVSGNFAIADASIESPVIATAVKGASDNTITIDYTGKYSANMVFYIPLPTGTIEGFDLTFNDTDNTTKSVSVNLTVARNGIILAPTLNMVTPTTMWSEDFTGYAANTKFNNSDIQTTGDYTAVAYGGAAIKYTTVDGNSDTKMYGDNNVGGVSPELLINKHGASSDGSFTVAGIPTLNSTTLSITFKVNGNLTFSSSTEGVSVSGTYNKDAKTYDGFIHNPNGASSLDITMTNSSSSNIRVDDFVVKTAAPSPSIVCSASMRTINAASLSSDDVTGVSLIGAVDGTGIGVSANQDWLEASLSGTTLSISANAYNHTKNDRVGVVYLKATGATTKEISVTQKPTIVPAPTLTAVAQDKSFTVSWTPDAKAGSYVAYYSTDDNLADPTSGTPLTIDTSGATYTASPSEDLVNGTNYTIYVRVNSVDANYSTVYGAPADNWVTRTVTPAAAAAATYTWTLANGDLGTTGSPESSVNKGTLSTTSSTITWSNTYTWGNNDQKYFGWDSSSSARGVQIGKGTSKGVIGNCTQAQFTTTGFTAPVTKVVVNAATASGGNATLSVTVNGTNYKNSGNNTVSLTTTATDYTFTGSATGTIVVTITNSAEKAIYLKAIKINTD